MKSISSWCTVITLNKWYYLQVQHYLLWFIAKQIMDFSQWQCFFSLLVSEFFVKNHNNGVWASIFTRYGLWFFLIPKMQKTWSVSINVINNTNTNKNTAKHYPNIRFQQCMHIFIWINMCVWCIYWYINNISPRLSNPRISFPTELVRPDSISCLCRNNFCLACPLPLSNSPCVSTPRRVDLPASTFPTTATLLILY